MPSKAWSRARTCAPTWRCWGGTGLKITLGNRGRIDVFVTVKGSPCHSSRPWDGVNAVTGATEAIRLLLAKVKVDKSHQQLGRQSLTVNHIRSFPDSTHTAQERCEFTLDRRLLPGDDPNEAFAEIERIAKEVERIEDPVSGKAYGVEVRLGPFMYPSLVTMIRIMVCQRFIRTKTDFGSAENRPPLGRRATFYERSRTRYRDKCGS